MGEIEWDGECRLYVVKRGGTLVKNALGPESYVGCPDLKYEPFFLTKRKNWPNPKTVCNGKVVAKFEIGKFAHYVPSDPKNVRLNNKTFVSLLARLGMTWKELADYAISSGCASDLYVYELLRVRPIPFEKTTDFYEDENCLIPIKAAPESYRFAYYKKKVWYSDVALTPFGPRVKYTTIKATYDPTIGPEEYWIPAKTLILSCRPERAKEILCGKVDADVRKRLISGVGTVEPRSFGE